MAVILLVAFQSVPVHEVTPPSIQNFLFLIEASVVIVLSHKEPSELRFSHSTTLSNQASLAKLLSVH